MKTKVKICGITNIKDAILAKDAGARALGFVFAESPRQIKPALAGEIIQSLPPEIEKVGVFVESSVQEINKVVDYCQLDTVQIYEWPLEGHELLTGMNIIQAFRVRSKEDIINAQESPAHIILFDNYRSEKYGGTGQSFNWDILKENRPQRNFILSGGLNDENIGRAIAELRPFAVDASSGLEEFPGRKDPEKIRKFFFRIKEAEQFLGIV